MPPIDLPALASDAHLAAAWAQVRANGGAPGMDGVTIEALETRYGAEVTALQAALLTGAYRPSPVRAVDVPKESGGTRTLGIPTVRDRWVLQALAQLLTPLWEPTFSPHSFAYRPGRSAQDAVAAAQAFLETGCDWVVDLDIEAFFDQVDHVRLMLRLHERVNDPGLLDLIADFLRAGVSREGRVTPTRRGIAQGSPLSPLLANIVLDELDQEHARRGWPQVRYADDCILLARDRAAAEAMLEATRAFLATRLKLRLHPRKTRIVRPAETAYLGFTYRVSRYGRVRRAATRESLQIFRRRVEELAAQRPGRTLDRLARDVATYVRGWTAYYGFCQAGTLQAARQHARTAVRRAAWALWATPARRRRELILRGVPPEAADRAAHALLFPDQIPALPELALALSEAWFARHGLGPAKPPRPRPTRPAHPPPSEGRATTSPARPVPGSPAGHAAAATGTAAPAKAHLPARWLHGPPPPLVALLTTCLGLSAAELAALSADPPPPPPDDDIP